MTSNIRAVPMHRWCIALVVSLFIAASQAVAVPQFDAASTFRIGFMTDNPAVQMQNTSTKADTDVNYGSGANVDFSASASAMVSPGSLTAELEADVSGQVNTGPETLVALAVAELEFDLVYAPEATPIGVDELAPVTAELVIHRSFYQSEWSISGSVGDPALETSAAYSGSELNGSAFYTMQDTTSPGVFSYSDYYAYPPISIAITLAAYQPIHFELRTFAAGFAQSRDIPEPGTLLLLGSGLLGALFRRRQHVRPDK